MNALTFSFAFGSRAAVVALPRANHRPAAARARVDGQVERRTSRYAAMDTHRPWSGALLPLEAMPRRAKGRLEAGREGLRKPERRFGAVHRYAFFG